MHRQQRHEKFNQIISKFIQYLKAINRSPATCKAYEEWIIIFFNHLQKIGIKEIKRVNTQIIKDYKIMLTKKRCRNSKKGYSQSTIAINIRAIRQFFRYLESTNHILVNPAEFIKEPKKERNLPGPILTSDEVENILNQPDLSTFVGIRDRTVLEVLYSAGIRQGELRGLRLCDIDLTNGQLQVKGKGSKDRVVPVGRHAVRFLEYYIRKVRPQLEKESRGNKTLFLNNRGGHLSKENIIDMIHIYTKNAGINKNIKTHTFRHTFATQLLKNGADITAVQRLLGHSDLSTTQIYTRVAGIDIKETHNKSHPRERDNEHEDEAVINRIKGKYRETDNGGKP